MTTTEFLNQFEVQYNNITSNQAPGLNLYEISVFLTKAQDEILKNYFLPQSNPKQAGFDANQKRQADFSGLMTMAKGEKIDSSSIEPTESTEWDDYKDKKLNEKSHVFKYPTDEPVFIVINEAFSVTKGSKTWNFQVVPLKYDEYFRLMSKPFKRPVKNQAWRLITQGNGNDTYVEIIAAPECDNVINEGSYTENGEYILRYVRRPKPIILGDLDGLTINGYKLTGTTEPNGAKETNGECELDPILHEEILQRAVELAKIAWTNTGQDNLQAVVEAGKRSE